MRGLTLNALTRPVNGLAVPLLCRFTLGAPERLRHTHETVPLGFGHQACERQQLAALILRETGEVRTVGFDRAQHAHAGVHLIRSKRVGMGFWI
jgi:hypothetical protein